MTTLDFRQVGARVKLLRTQRGMTQEKLAEAAELSVPFVSHVERGRKKASLESLVRIADALDTTLDHLLSGNQPKDPSAFLPELQSLLGDCSPRERCIIFEISFAVKQSLRSHRAA